VFGDNARIVEPSRERMLRKTAHPYSHISNHRAG
jgi:hypothetical protein